MRRALAHDRNACGVLDGSHKHVAPARDDKVDIPILGEQRSDFRASLDGLHERGREHRARKCGPDRACERRGGVSGLLLPLKDRSIT